MPVRARARSSTCTIRQDNENLPPHHFFGVPASSTASLLVRRHFFSLPRPMLGATLARSCCCCPRLSLLRSGLWLRTHSSICHTYAGRLCQTVDWRKIGGFPVGDPGPNQPLLKPVIGFRVGPSLSDDDQVTRRGAERLRDGSPRFDNDARERDLRGVIAARYLSVTAPSTRAARPTACASRRFASCTRRARRRQRPSPRHTPPGAVSPSCCAHTEQSVAARVSHWLGGSRVRSLN